MRNDSSAELHGAGERARSRDELGAHEAEGLFETIRATAGRPALWRRHLERLMGSARELGFRAPAPDVLEAAVVKALEASDLGDAVIRLTIMRKEPEAHSPTSVYQVEIEPLSSRLWAGTSAGAATAIFSSRPFVPGPLALHKITNRQAYAPAREETRAQGADEALLLSPPGQVLEGTVSNVFAVFGEEIVTPPLAAGILPGIMRALVLEACREREIPSREDEIRRERLLSADEVFLTNAVQRVVPVATLEGRRIPKRTIGLELMQICNRLADVGG